MRKSHLVPALILTFACAAARAQTGASEFSPAKPESLTLVAPVSLSPFARLPDPHTAGPVFDLAGPVPDSSGFQKGLMATGRFLDGVGDFFETAGRFADCFDAERISNCAPPPPDRIR